MLTVNCQLAYIRRGLRVVGFDIKAMREPQVVELANSKFHAFLLCLIGRKKLILDELNVNIN